MSAIGTAEIIAGQKTRGAIRLGSDTDGSPVHMPVLVVAGKRSGPRVWVHGCVHGEEFGGAAAIIRLFQELDPAEMAGTVILVPVTNVPAFKARSRISPLDGANLNRIFPGDPQGTFSYRLAHKLTELITQNADYVVDLHSGGIGALVPFYAIYNDDGSEAARRSAWLAERVGTDLVWRVKSTPGLGGSVTGQIVARGIPAIAVECGGGNVTEEHEELFKQAVRNVLRAVKVLPGEPALCAEYTILSDGVFIFTGEGGLFVPHCSAGSIVNKGDLLAVIMNLYGDVTEELRSPIHGFVAAIGHRYYPVEPGQLMAEVFAVEARGARVAH